MKGVNKAVLLGVVGADPEVKLLTNGNHISSLSLATGESWKDKETGEKKEITEWHRIKFFGKLAEIVGEYVKKGTRLYIEGSIKTDKWTDKNGIERYTTNIIANEMTIISGKNDEKKIESAKIIDDDISF